MFRAQQNAFDDVVAKATDENLTMVNWEFMLDVCDRASESPSAPKDVVQALIKRLAHRNANVQLYTLELANSLAQNCGQDVHRELASRSFTEALLRLANDRNTHAQVKTSILERMAEWTKMFQGNHDLGIMEQAYQRLKQTNPHLQPPSKPHKQQITEADKRKEEEELQMALQLSIKENSAATPSAASSNKPVTASPTSPINGGTTQPAPSQPVSSSGTTAATVSRVRALFDFQPSEPGELPFKKGDIIAVIESVYRDWWRGSLRGQTGIFPLNYVEKLSDPTPEELAREAQMEAEVFGEIKNVEKLLTLLSTSSPDGQNVKDSEEITTLYHSTLAIRPKLIELIGKYSQRKDDFTQLNEKFIKARRDYEMLLDQSMSQPQPGYSRPSQQPYGQPQYGQQQQQQQPYGQYPPQQDPSRFYASGPPAPDPSITPQPQHAAGTAPSPFYLAGQAPPPQQIQTQYAPDPRGRTPVGGRPPNQGPSDPYNRRPESTYDNPQEIGTSGYQSPVDSRPPGGPTYPNQTGQGQPQPYQPYSGPQQGGQQSHQMQDQQPYGASQPPEQRPEGQQSYPGSYPPESPLSPAPLNPSHGGHATQPYQPAPKPDGQHQQQQTYQDGQYGAPPPNAPPPQPSYAAPTKPQSPQQSSVPYPSYAGPAYNPGSPTAGGAPPLPPNSGYPGQATYQAYHPPGGQAPVGGGAFGSGGGGGAGGAADPSSFYR